MTDDGWTTAEIPLDGSDSWLQWLAPMAEHFADEAAFAAWRSGIVGFASMGHIAVQGLWFHGQLAAALLLRPTRGHAILLMGMGALDRAAFRVAIAALQNQAVAVSWDESTGPAWLGWVEDLGFKPF